MKERLFTAKEAWKGGFYELAIEVGSRSDPRLLAALTALWDHPDIQGCYLDRHREPADQPRRSPDKIEDGSHLLGTARLPNGTDVPCGSFVWDDDSDWLVFYLPMGSLQTAYPVGSFPFGEASWSGPWRWEVEDWLYGVGLWVARTASYQLGLIGYEVSGQISSTDISARGIPEDRFIGYLWPSAGSVAYHRRTLP